jgi:hypothetical protein
MFCISKTRADGGKLVPFLDSACQIYPETGLTFEASKCVLTSVIYYRHHENPSMERIQSTNTITFLRMLLQKATTLSFLRETMIEDKVVHVQVMKGRVANTGIALLIP